MNTGSLIQLVVLLLLLALSAFFSSAETSMTSMNQMRLRTLVAEGNKKAAVLSKVLEQYGKMLSAVLIGNNIVNISASALATTFTISVFGNYLVGIATGILTVIILVFGEIVPKTWASLHSEKVALAYASLIYGLMVVFTPLIWIMDLFSNAIFHILRIDKTSSKNPITENELKTIIDVSHEGGIIETEERAMINNVFDFSDALAKDIMIPRINMTAVNVTASYGELFSIFKESMYTRIPVYENDTDNIIGIVNIKDLLLIENTEAFCIRDVLREAYYTYEYKKTADLLFEMRESASNMALVLNEYGACEGLITLEDLLEEIVGEIRDEYDEDEELLIQEIAEGEYLVAGEMKLDDINASLGTNLFSEDYDSIGGIVIEKLDRLPIEKESVEIADGIILQVEKINKNKIEQIFMKLPERTITEVIDNPEEDNVEKKEVSNE